MKGRLAGMGWLTGEMKGAMVHADVELVARPIRSRGGRLFFFVCISVPLDLR